MHAAFGYNAPVFSIMLNQNVAFLCGVPVLALLLVVLALRKHNFWELSAFTLFFLYLLLVASVTLFPIPLDSAHFRDTFNRELFLHRVNLIPLYFGRFATPRSIFFAVYLNVLLTIPFGFGASFFVRWKLRDFVWLAPLAGLAIESAQILAILFASFPYRVLDVNDILANTLGVWIGAALFYLFAAAYRALARLLRLPPRGLSGYLLRVTAPPS